MNRFVYLDLLALTVASIIAGAVLPFCTAAHSQNPEWMNFTSGTYVNALADDENYLWIGGDGVTRLDKATGEIVFYNKETSGLPNYCVSALAIDIQENIWIGTYHGGLAKFDGTNCTRYNKETSGLPSNYVWALAIDAQGNIWVGTYGGGLAKFDGTDWTIYNMGNSGLPDNKVDALAIDAQGDKWIGTCGGGLAKFDGESWTVYNPGNSGLPDDCVSALAIDAQG
ncbi:MAG: hypothetical protein KAV99_07650, partial [Candidatus Latescibacteria bacterium]|nr:hypothetical protein [Candidatus Latescibacterota bacterium]